MTRPTLILGLALASVVASTMANASERPHYGGELRLLIPSTALDLERFDPLQARTPLDLVLVRTACEPLLTEDPTGVQPRLLLAPEGDPHGRSLALRLRAGLRFSNGTPLRAREVVESLSRLAAPDSPMRALLLPVAGGAGLSARSETEIVAALDFPYPDWPLGLTHPSACPVASAHGKVVGWSGPFIPEGKVASPVTRLDANPEAPEGRPFADRFIVRTISSRANASRSLASGGAELSALPVAETKAVDGPLSVATYLVVNATRPGLADLPTRLASSLDRTELVRTYVRSPATPLYGLIAPSVEPHPVAAPVLGGAARLALPLEGELLVEFGQDEQRAVAERLQVKLHDLGADLKVVALPRTDLFGRLARGEYDAALATVPAIPEAGLNLAQVLLLGGLADVAKAELTRIGAIADAPGRREQASSRARALATTVPVLPLYAQGTSIAVRPGVVGLHFDPSGVFDPGDLWLLDAR